MRHVFGSYYYSAISCFPAAYFEQEETEITEKEPLLRSLCFLLFNYFDSVGCGRWPRWEIHQCHRATRFAGWLSCDAARGPYAVRPRFAIGLAILCGLALHPASFCAAQGDLQVAEELGISVGQLRRLHIERGMKNVDLLQAPKALVPRLLRKLEFPEIQRLRADFRLLQEKGTEGVVSSQAKVKAVERLHVMQNGTFAPKCAGLPTGPRDSAKLLPLSKSIPQEAWTWLGPGNVGGRTRSILIHPQRPDTMWAGSVGGGVWRTDDGGQQWFPLNDLMANLVICCMVMDPRSPDTIYAGTGEGFGNVDSLPGAGIFKTTDGGRTWTQLQATANPNFRHVNRLAVSPDGAVLLAATRSGIFRSADAGQTWTQQLTVEMADVDFHPRDSLQAVAGAVADGTVYHSTDGGIAWILSQRTDVWSGRVEVTYATADPTMIYASVNQNGGLLCRSTDGGQSFSARNGTSQYLASQGWYDNVVWAGDPTNPNLVIVGGVDLRRSMDGGSTLIDISCWYQPNSAHADHHVIVADPRYDGRTNVTVFFGNDGGIYKTEDVYSVGTDEARSRGWINLNNNYGVTQFYGAAGNVQSGTIVAGAQDNGTLCYLPARGAQGWIDTFGGDGGVCAADPTDPRYFYGEYVNLMIHRSADGGQSAEFICGRPDAGPQWKPAPYCIPDARDGKANFIAPFLIDPNQPTRILAGGVSLGAPTTLASRSRRRAVPPGRRSSRPRIQCSRIPSVPSPWLAAIPT